MSAQKPRQSTLARVGGLAVGLGIGAAVATTPWVAVAEPNVDISVDGMTVFKEGDATAVSGPGDIAIALGDQSSAFATGNLDLALARGSESTAETGDGSYVVAIANGFNSFAAVNKAPSTWPSPRAPTALPQSPEATKT